MITPYIKALIDLLVFKNDPKHDGLSNRAEGTFQAIAALGRSLPIEPVWAQQLGEAIIGACKRYNQFEMIGRSDSAKPWPTNRFALEALEALGIEKTRKAA